MQFDQTPGALQNGRAHPHELKTGAKIEATRAGAAGLPPEICRWLPEQLRYKRPMRPHALSPTGERPPVSGPIRSRVEIDRPIAFDSSIAASRKEMRRHNNCTSYRLRLAGRKKVSRENVKPQICGRQAGALTSARTSRNGWKYRCFHNIPGKRARCGRTGGRHEKKLPQPTRGRAAVCVCRREIVNVAGARLELCYLYLISISGN